MILAIMSHGTWLVPAIVHIDNTNIILLLGGKTRDNKFCLENLVEGFENHPKNEVNYKNEDNLKNSAKRDTRPLKGRELNHKCSIGVIPKDN